MIFLIGMQVWRHSLSGDELGDSEPIDVGSQPKDLSLAAQSPEIALVSTDSSVTVLRGTAAESTAKLGFTVTASAIAPDGSRAVIGGQDGKLRVYRINGGVLAEVATLEKHRGPITVIRYSPDGSSFASADANREAVVWDCVSLEVRVDFSRRPIGGLLIRAAMGCR